MFDSDEYPGRRDRNVRGIAVGAILGLAAWIFIGTLVIVGVSHR